MGFGSLSRSIPRWLPGILGPQTVKVTC
jgi:hypothetical protein